jgi:hypothetical protein
MPRNNIKKISSPPVQVKNEQNNLQSILGYVAPTEFVSLPSKGRFYSPDHALHGVEEVEIRFLSAKDLDILSSKTLLKKGIAVDRMIKNILVDKSIDVDELLLADKNAIIISARAGTFGNEYPVQMGCQECDELFTHTFDLSDPEIKDIEHVEVSENSTFFITLPKTGVIAECCLLSSKDQQFLQEKAKKKEKMGLPDSSITDQYKSFIVSLNGNTDRGLVDEFVDVMPAADMHADMHFLQKEYEKSSPDLNLIQECECTHCGAVSEVSVPFTANFFWPD